MYRSVSSRISEGSLLAAWQSYYLNNDDEMKEHRAIKKSIIEKLLVNAGIPEEQVPCAHACGWE